MKLYQEVKVSSTSTYNNIKSAIYTLMHQWLEVICQSGVGADTALIKQIRYQPEMTDPL